MVLEVSKAGSKVHLLRRSVPFIFLIVLVLEIASPSNAQSSDTRRFLEMGRYSVRIDPGDQPRLQIERDHEAVFVVPVVAGLATDTTEERLTNITYALHQAPGGWELDAKAASNLWTARRFVWRFLPDHIDFQQFASGHGKLGRCYFLANGVSNTWDDGTTEGSLWDTTIYADRYFSPSPNHANQFEFNIAMPQVLGFNVNRISESAEDFRPERMNGLFAPPPLFLAFQMDKTWTGVGIGTKPGEYQFPALEYTGSRFAGASWFVDYMGYRKLDGEFASPMLAMTFAYDPLDALASYTEWLDKSGFSTRPGANDALWHHLPIFCGFAEQTTDAEALGVKPSMMATQANYESWIATLEQRNLPMGTIVIDDKWQQGYGNFEVDTRKWPDMKGFIAAQHAKGRHVLLWVPVADTDGLPDELCVKANGKCVIADVGKPEYEAYMRAGIKHLVRDLGVDGFKEDWVDVPTTPGLPLTGPETGIEFVRRFQWILWSEAHKWKPDAMVETQTPNALFRESSDVTRLNDIWFATRNVPDVLRLRARIAHISGWPLVDTDNASSTGLKNWWSYMQAQPSIGVPALYFVTKTESTHESPSADQWAILAAIWREYIEQVKTQY